MKKMASVMVILVIGSASLFAFGGIGVQGGYTFGEFDTRGANVAITFKPTGMNWVFGIDTTIATATWGFGIGVFVDNWLLDMKLVDTPVITLSWYTGWGAYIDLNMQNGYDYDAYLKQDFGENVYYEPVFSFEKTHIQFDIGARIPIGLSMFFLEDTLELYMQATGTIGLSYSKFQTDTGKAEGFGFSWGVPITMGVRYWF